MKGHKAKVTGGKPVNAKAKHKHMPPPQKVDAHPKHGSKKANAYVPNRKPKKHVAAYKPGMKPRSQVISF